MSNGISVVIADDHPFVRAGLRMSLMDSPDIEVVAEADNGTLALELCQQWVPTILLLDLSMPGTTSVEIIRYIARFQPQTKIIVLTAYDDDTFVQQVMRAGACGYILKDEAPDSIVSAIYGVAQGEKWFSPGIIEKLR